MLGEGVLRYALSWVGLASTDDQKAEIARQYGLLANATTYQAWLTAAEKLDELEGVGEWKKDPTSPYYDSRLIQERLVEMKRLQAEGDIASMVFMLRSGLQRNLGGIGNHMLHDYSHVGTKLLIEEHQRELIRMLLRVCHCCESELSLEKKLAFFTESRHALGKTALLLSGGASLGMYHFGVLKTLFQHELLPRIISGSSAGAIVAGIIAVRTTEELELLFSGDIETIRRAIRLEFFDPIGSLERKLRRILKTGHLMDVKKLQRALIDNMGDVTFHEAYERTGRIVNITVSPGNDYEKPRLLNYLTAPNVLVWSAASASCALPGLYEPVELFAKNARGEKVPYHMSNVKWTDGSLQSDLPMNRLQELFNVNYFIVSQTNPHAIPFVQRAQRQAVRRQAGGAGRGVVWRLASAVGYMVGSEVVHRCQQAIALGLAPKLLALILNQKYVGDITIVPPLSVRSYTRIISNPTPENLSEFILRGERQTWPSVGIIRSQCEVEIVLDQCVRRLAAQAQARAVAAGGAGAVGSGTDGRRRLRRSDTGLGERRHTHLDLNQFFEAAAGNDGDDSLSVSSEDSIGSFLSDSDLPRHPPLPDADVDPAAAAAAAGGGGAEGTGGGEAEQPPPEQGEGPAVNPISAGGGSCGACPLRRSCRSAVAPPPPPAGEPPPHPGDATSGAAPPPPAGAGAGADSDLPPAPTPAAAAAMVAAAAMAAAAAAGDAAGDCASKAELAQRLAALIGSRLRPAPLSRYSC